MSDLKICAVARGVKGSVYKFNLVSSLIRGLDVERARAALALCNRSAAVHLNKVLMSAVANAQNNSGCEIDSLYVDRVLLGKDKALKRMHPRARGRGFRVIKHYSYIKVILGSR